MKEEIVKLIGLDESKVKVYKVEEEKEKGKIVRSIYLELKSKKYRCPRCNKFTSSVHDILKPIRLKYLDIAGYSSVIYLKKRRFICHRCSYKFTEPTDIHNKNYVLSNKLKIKIRKDLLNKNMTIKEIARQNNVSDYTVRKELKIVMNNHSEDIRTLPRIISFDEFKADTSYGKYAFIINDPIHKITIDILPSRKKDYLNNYFTKITNRHSVEYVIGDMYEPYLLVTKAMFPKAKYVADRFHFERYIMAALDNIRIRLQDEYGEKTKEYKLLKKSYNASLIRIYYNRVNNWYSYIKIYKNGHMTEILKIDLLQQILNVSEELKRGYELKELFLDIIHHSDYEHAENDLLTWIELCNESKLEEFIEAAKTINNWLEYIVYAFIDKRLSNGYTEGVNKKIKDIKRLGYGYKNFEFFRLRLLYILNQKIRGRK